MSDNRSAVVASENRLAVVKFEARWVDIFGKPVAPIVNPPGTSLYPATNLYPATTIYPKA